MRQGLHHRLMTRAGALALGALLAAPVAASPGAQAAGTAAPAQAPKPAAAKPGTFDGARALEDARQLVALGPRVAGTPGAAKARDFITSRLKAAGLTVTEQPFDVRTPLGQARVVNLRAVIHGSGAARAPRIIVAGHYDTKRFTGFTFLGANDGGSSAAFLLELARVLPAGALPVDVELLFLDGEEAVVEWEGTDHTYGSRHYVEAAREAGTLKEIGALILVDMIGDRDLRVMRETNSTPWLTDTIWSTAERLGRTEFSNRATPIEDDHLEFLDAGVPAVDIIDLEYPAWHTKDDTMDKLSAGSLQAVGDVVLAALPQIAKKIAR